MFYRKLVLLGSIVLLNACNLSEIQPTIIIAPRSNPPVQNIVPTAAAVPTTQPEIQLIAQVTRPPATVAPTVQPPQPFEDRTDPVLLLASFYNAINLRDYVRAYNYWERAPRGATLDQFAQGYTDTVAVSGVVRLPLASDAGAGSVYAAMRTALVSTRTNGSQQTYSACYVARKSNVPVGNSPTPDPNWRLFDGQARVASGPVTPVLVDQACVGTPYEPQEPLQLMFDNRETPITLLESYYSAINLRDYARAYSYWETPPQNASLAAFMQGYANTAGVDVYAGLSIQGGGAAGSIYVEIPTLLIATNTDGSQQVFAGCYVARRSNVPVGDSPTPDPNWRLYNASVRRVSDFAAGLARLSQPCIG